MSVVDAYYNKKKEDEEKKVVGQQQKTQSSANKPTGSTSIPKDKQEDSRTQKSAASSLRTENNTTTAGPRKEESKTNIIRRNTVTANKTEQRQNGRTKVTNQNQYSTRKNTYTPQQHGGNTGSMDPSERGDHDRRRNAFEKNRQIYGENRFNTPRMNHEMRNRTGNLMDTVNSLPDAPTTQNSRTRNLVSGKQFVGSNRQEISQQEANDIERRIANVDGYGNATLNPMIDEFSNLDRYTPETKTSPWNQNLLTKDEISKGVKSVTPEIAKQWLDPNTELDEGAKQIAKAYAQQELDKFNYRGGHQPILNSEEDRQKYADLVNLINKTSGFASFNQGFINPFENLAGYAMEHLPFVNEDTKNFYNQNRDIASENAKVQNPVSSAIGELSGNAAEYLISGPLFDALGTAFGIANPVAKYAFNLVGQQAQDELLSTQPMIENMKRQGYSDEEINKAVLSDRGVNLLGNATMGLLSNVFKPKSRVPNVDVPESQLIKNVTEQPVQPVKNVDDIVRNLPEEQILRNATDNPFNGFEEAIQPADINKSLGGNANDFSVNKDNAIRRLTDLGGDADIDAYRALVNAADAEDLNAFNKAISDYNATTGGKYQRQLNRLDDAVNGRLPETLTQENYRYINDNIDVIEDGLNRIGNLEGLSDLGKKHLGNAYDLLDQYETAIRNGGDAEKIAKDLNKALGNLDNQAKKIDGYDGVFSKWKGANTARGDLYSNTGRINNVDSPLTAEEQAVVDSFGYESNYARPANQSQNVLESKAVANNDIIPDIPKADADIPEVSEPPKQSVSQTSRVPNESTETTEDLWSQLTGQKPLNESNAEKVGNGTPYNEQGQKLSKLHRTLENTDKLTEEEKKVFADKNGFWYDPDNEKKLADQAKDAVARDIDGVYNEYTGDDLDLGKLGGEDAHKMFTASYDYTKLAQEALKNGDQATADLYNQKARNIMLNAREAATKGGQFNAAIKYYAKTPQGVIDKTYDILQKDISKFKANNPKLAGNIDDVSKQIANRLKGIDTDSIMSGSDEAAKENLRRQVIDALGEISNSTKDKKLKKTLSDLSAKDIDALINSKYASDIAKQIDMFSMGAFGVKPETIDKVLDTFEEAEKYGINSKQYYELEQKAYAMLANDLREGKSFRDKVDAWRYFSMLSSPLTHIRNTVGNATNNALTGLKNDMSALIEAAADRAAKANGGIEGGRTKSILNPLDGADQELIKLSADDFDNNAYRQFKEGGSRYINVQRNLENAGNVWKDKGVGKVLNKITGANEFALDVEDTLFGKAKYQTSLAGFLKANGADASIFRATDDASRELLAEAREYALKQANEATFHQTNAFANWWSQGVKNLRDSDKAGMRLLGNAANVTMPFVKTPSNILAQGWAYSPAEFINVLGDISKLKKGTMNGSELVDDLSKALTGTAMVGAGAWLANEGIIAIGNGDKDEDEFNENRGIKRLSVKIGDDYIDISQLVPAAIPIIIGATVQETIKNAKNGNGDAALDSVFAGLSSIGDTVVDTTMLSGISQLLSSVRYATDTVDMAAKIGTKIAGNYASQLMPTLGSQIEKTVDDTKRTTYTDKQGTLSKALDQQMRYLKTKVPFGQKIGEDLEQSDNDILKGIGEFMTNEPQIDRWGNETKVQDYGIGTTGRVVNNFLNPFNTTTDQHDPVDEEISTLYSEIKDPKILKYAETNSQESNVNGYKMTDKEWTQYQKTYGSLKHALAETLMNSQGYNALDADSKVESLDDLKKFAKAYTLNDMDLKTPSKANQELIDAYNEGGPGAVVEFVAGVSAPSGSFTPGEAQQSSEEVSNATGNTDESVVASGEMSDELKGKAILRNAKVREGSAAEKEIKESIENGDLEGAQKKADSAKQLKEAGITYSSSQQTYYDALDSNPDLSVEEFVETYKKIDSNGNQKITQGEFIDFLNDGKFKLKDAEPLINEFYPKTYTKVPVYENGEWAAKNKKKTVSKESKESTSQKKVNLIMTGNAQQDARIKAKANWKNNQQSINAAKEKAANVNTDSELPNVQSTGSWNVEHNGKSYDLHKTKTYQRAQAAGWSDSDFLKHFHGADTDNSGTITKKENQAYINALEGLSRQEKHDMFDVLQTRKAKNPY